MKKSMSPITLALLVSSSLAVAACAEKPTEESAPKSAVEEKPAPESPAYPAADKAAVDEVLAAYEEARVLFFTDKAEGIDAAAQKMAASAKKALGSAPDAAKPSLTGIADAATKLEAGMKEGIEPARKLYGDVSKHVVALLVAYPSLAEGRHAFECPMSPGYKKWVQTSDKLENPYMGQRMPSCGGEADWKI